MNTITRSLNSIINQTYIEFELIVVNSNPSHYPVEIASLLSEYKNKCIIPIKLIQSNHSINGSIARNIGLSEAEGKYVSFIDDDDEWFPNKIFSQITSALANNSSLVYSDYYTENINNQYIKHSELVNKTTNICADILRENIIGTTSVPLICNKVIKELGGFNEKMDANQEWDLWIRIIHNKYTISYDQTVVAIKHYSDNALTKDINKRISGWNMIFDNHSDLYHQYKRQYSCALAIYSKELFNNKHRSMSIFIMIKALFNYFFSINHD